MLNFHLCSFNNVLNLFVAAYDGTVYVYEVNTNKGRECRQTNRFLLFSILENPTSPRTAITKRTLLGTFYKYEFYSKFVHCYLV